MQVIESWVVRVAAVGINEVSAHDLVIWIGGVVERRRARLDQIPPMNAGSYGATAWGRARCLPPPRGVSDPRRGSS
jgi:hypothetical protein